MKVLIIDNNINRDSWGATSLLRIADAHPEYAFEVRRAPERDLPRNLDGFQKIIISGSKTSILDQALWIVELEAFLKKAADRAIPMLGICYGHQILGKILFGDSSVGRALKPEFGWIKLIRNETKSEILKGLPQEFYTFSSHNDEVSKVDPALAYPLAHSDLCQIQGFEMKAKPIYGIQFHPEKDLDAAHKIYGYLKNEKREKCFLKLAEGPKLYNKIVGETIFNNFLKNRP